MVAEADLLDWSKGGGGALCSEQIIGYMGALTHFFFLHAFFFLSFFFSEGMCNIMGIILSYLHMLYAEVKVLR